MDILPILSTLRRHKTAAALIVLEIALSCAIICNAVFLISTRLERMDRVTGLAENDLVRLSITGIGQEEDAELKSRVDIAALREIPGVVAATSTNQVPFGNSSWNSSINLTPDQDTPSMSAAMYMGDEQLLETFGLRVVEGRDFTANEYVTWKALSEPGSTVKVPAVILSSAAARKLFPGTSAVGQRIYTDDEAIVVVGVVDHLIRVGDNGGPAEAQFSMIQPIKVDAGTYVVRTSPERRAEVQAAAVATLDRINPNRIITDQNFFTEMRDDYYRQDRAMAWLLIIVCIALLVVTALGIVGLASFWVQQRTKQIGIRRALGATRGQILRYFQTENVLLATLGIVLGMLLAYGINMLLMQHYELPRLPAVYLPVGAIALWLLGQIAVFGPARRAALVPPAVATRSV